MHQRNVFPGQEGSLNTRLGKAHGLAAVWIVDLNSKIIALKLVLWASLGTEPPNPEEILDEAPIPFAFLTQGDASHPPL